MLNKICIYAFMLAFCSSIGYSQAQKSDNKEEKKVDNTPTYTLFLKYPLNTFVIYKYSEISKIQRMKNEKAIDLSYERNADYYFRQRMSKFVKEGFTDLTIGIDSLKYSFVKDGKTTTFSSTISDDIFKWNEDIEQYFIPMNRNFNIVINPYLEISDLNGEMIEKDRNLVKDTKDVSKPEDIVLWENSLADDRLLQISDPKKINFVKGEIKMDSSWKTNISYQLEGFTFNDTIVAKLVDQRGGFLFVESNFVPKVFDKTPSIIYGKRKSPAYIDSTDLSAKIVVTMSPYGLVDETLFQIRGKLMLHDANESFIEMVDVTYKWKQLGQWEY